MRTRRDYSSFPIEYQIKKLNTKIKFLKVFSIFWIVFIIVISVIIWIYTLERDFSIVLLISIPVSVFFGGYIQIKEYKKEIEKLKKNINV